MDTKKMLCDSMFQLLSVYPFEKLTVQKLVENAGVSRSTFYRQFSDLYDLMNYSYQDYVDGLLAKVYNNEISWKKTLECIMVFFDKNYEFFKRTLETKGANSFGKFLFKYSNDFYKNIYEQHYPEATDDEIREANMIIEYITGGSISVVEYWLQSGRSMPPSDVASLIIDQLPEMFRQYLY